MFIGEQQTTCAFCNQQTRRSPQPLCVNIPMPMPSWTSPRSSRHSRNDALPPGEALIGARAFRVIFAGISLPLALAAVVYFINHRYSGTPLWNLRDVPGVHAAVWGLSLVSFFFLYPSTFNLLEVRSWQTPSYPAHAGCHSS